MHDTHFMNKVPLALGGPRLPIVKRWRCATSDKLVAQMLSWHISRHRFTQTNNSHRKFNQSFLNIVALCYDRIVNGKGQIANGKLGRPVHHSPFYLGAVWVRCLPKVWSSTRLTRSHKKQTTHLRRFVMKQFKNWKAIVFASLVPLLIALQPAVTYACSVGAGTHGGC